MDGVCATRVAPVALIVLLPPAASAFMVRYGGALPTVMQRPCPAALAPSSSMLADAAVASPDMITSLQQFQDSHSILIATLSAVAVRVVVSEVRFRIERPVMDKVGEKAINWTRSRCSRAVRVAHHLCPTAKVPVGRTEAPKVFNDNI